jgi:hypothetical protein
MDTRIDHKQFCSSSTRKYSNKFCIIVSFESKCGEIAMFLGALWWPTPSRRMLIFRYKIDEEGYFFLFFLNKNKPLKYWKNQCLNFTCQKMTAFWDIVPCSIAGVVLLNSW